MATQPTSAAGNSLTSVDHDQCSIDQRFDEETEKQTPEDVDNDDAASAISNRSDDSEMEPFDSYKEKIEQLCNYIDLKNCIIEVIQHGYGYQNCVYSLTSTSDSTEAYVLRVATLEADDLHKSISDGLATLGYLQQKLPVPRMKHHDLSNNNPLGKPYTIQTRLAGVSLSKIYEEMSYEEKLAIIDQVVELVVQLEAIRFPIAGLLKSKTNVTPTPACQDLDAGDLTIEPFDSRYPVDKPESDPSRLREREGPHLKDLMKSLLEGWIEYDRRDEIVRRKGLGQETAWTDDDTYTIPPFKRLLSMLQDLDDQSAFKDQPYPIVLYHWDLEPRNILIENSTGAWKISGIIDWDEVEAVPRPLARRPPVWMWDFSEEPETGYYNSDQYPDPELNEESQNLKDYFDGKAEKALPDYREDAYGHGRWLRRMFPYCKSGLNDTTDMRYCLELLDQWEARPKPVKSSTGTLRTKSEGTWERLCNWLSGWRF